MGNTKQSERESYIIMNRKRNVLKKLKEKQEEKDVNDEHEEKQGN